jgi:hypothetical protein
MITGLSLRAAMSGDDGAVLDGGVGNGDSSGGGSSITMIS